MHHTLRERGELRLSLIVATTGVMIVFGVHVFLGTEGVPRTLVTLAHQALVVGFGGAADDNGFDFDLEASCRVVDK